MFDRVESSVLSEQSFIIVGAGLAGARAAEAMRTEGFTGRIILVAAESEYPYIRPPLSKEYLAGTAERNSIFVQQPTWYAENDVEIVPGDPAVTLSPTAHELVLGSGQILHFDKLLLATGASSRRFPGPGVGFPGVHHLRTVEESEQLRDELAPGGRSIVIVGAGWIGLEVAAAAKGYGNDVVVLGRESVPLEAVVGSEVGAVFLKLHTDNGVDVRMNTAVTELVGADGIHHVGGVRLSSGEIVAADVVVVGIGAIPNIQLAEDAGLRLDNGIVVDATFRSSHPDIYAVGDVANVFHPVLGHPIRIEHWANAENAGAAAGRSMVGNTSDYDLIPYFYTDQFDLGMEFSGYADWMTDATVVFRGNRDERRFIAFWVANSRVVAGMNVNVWDVNETVQKFIRSGVVVDADRLADESITLESQLGGTD
ncbi:NAD(P)/FAD-dependent oxidoreductase [Leifsonia sp. A12D58]|uniref:NAD(P)/FAD-dependent oxidoreductase n=1 Tax=Leifsonia sp. A12D58 TaxID=3397674 RepID=UPI0039E09C42